MRNALSCVVNWASLASWQTHTMRNVGTRALQIGIALSCSQGRYSSLQRRHQKFKSTAATTGLGMIAQMQVVAKKAIPVTDKTRSTLSALRRAIALGGGSAMRAAKRCQEPRARWLWSLSAHQWTRSVPVMSFLSACRRTIITRSAFQRIIVPLGGCAHRVRILQIVLSASGKTARMRKMGAVSLAYTVTRKKEATPSADQKMTVPTAGIAR
mmetsp:Transcript_23033/g.46576  ORF Transcript_23033/g.46576 Transcript_23033/m.46576 type:complete len:212 (+) Transcript_23033:520-1155(+)